MISLELFSSARRTTNQGIVDCHSGVSGTQRHVESLRIIPRGGLPSTDYFCVLSIVEVIFGRGARAEVLQEKKVDKLDACCSLLS